MPVPRYDVEESHQKQLPTNTRFVRFQKNLNLYHRTMTMRIEPPNWRFYVAIANKLLDERLVVDSSILAAEDRNLYEAINFRHRVNPNAGQVPMAMIARLSAQSVVFEVLVMLLDDELIKRSALHDFVDLASVRDIRTPCRILMECFDFGTYLSQCPQEVFMSQSYAMPLHWLACMITRGAKVDLGTIMLAIERKKLFGALNREKYLEIIRLHATFSVNSQASIKDKEETGYVGMHLPMGVLEADVLSAVHDAFDNLDEMVQNFQDLCGNLFGFSEKDLVPVGRSLEQLELLRRYNAGDTGDKRLVWEAGYVFEVFD